MKKTILTLSIIGVLALTAGAVFAQRGGGGYGPGYGPCYGGAGYGPGFGRNEYMKKELGITDKQQQQLFDIGTKYRQKYFENRNDLNKIQALREEHRKEVDSVFTKEQKEKLNNFGPRGKRGPRGGGYGPGYGPQNWR